MNTYQGKVAFQGVAIGVIRELSKKENTVRRVRISDTEAELVRFQAAKEETIALLGELYEKAVKSVGETSAAIFEIHQMMLDDEDYLDSIRNIVHTQTVNAEYAVAVTADNFANMFSAMEDEYMKARAADVKDISGRLISVLSGVGEEAEELAEPCIISADDLAPSETVQLDKSKVLAFVTRQGSVNSHTAILARTMNIPAIVSADFPNDVDGQVGVVDGEAGLFLVSPDEDTLADYRRKESDLAKKARLLQELKGKDTVTKSGKRIHLYTNIGGVGDVASALHNDAEGIGLFRSEFLYLQSETYPTEEEQLKAYRTVAEMMAGKKVIIRTLDIGADKQIGYFGLDEEENPALGYRAIRICLTSEDIFRTQLRALCRASVYGTIAVMIPMITSLWEVKRAKGILWEVQEELQGEGVPMGELEFGIMIETPAAVMIADDLAAAVDFFSIGTNDLTQYTLAVDRQNPRLDPFYDAHHPAILKMIRLVVESAHRQGIWAGICGELGADLALTEQFVRMGIDELSVSPSMVLPVRKRVRELS